MMRRIHIYWFQLSCDGIPKIYKNWDSIQLLEETHGEVKGEVSASLVCLNRKDGDDIKMSEMKVTRRTFYVERYGGGKYELVKVWEPDSTITKKDIEEFFKRPSYPNDRIIAEQTAVLMAVISKSEDKKDILTKVFNQLLKLRAKSRTDHENY
jgi:hypothetical protein